MKLLLFVSVLFVSTFSFADAWDNMTKTQAEAVVAELKINPYIFDYCDCCDYSGEYASKAYLLKVKSAEIVECSWDSNYYTVSLTVDYICELINTANGLMLKDLKKTENEGDHSGFYMNYTWGFNEETKLATAYFNIVDYDVYVHDTKSCKVEFSYPTPKEVKRVSKDKKYAKWYKANVQ